MMTDRSIEMNETHASFSREEVEALVQKVGLSVEQFISFTNIEGDLKLHHISLEPTTLQWDRKFLLVALKNKTEK